MFWFLLSLLALYAMLTELRLQFDLQHFDTTQARLQLSASGLHRIWNFHLNKTADGHQLTMTDQHGTRPLNTGQLRQSRGSLIADTFFRADKARHFLLSHLHLDMLDGLLLLRTADAARSAILSGTLQGLLTCIPGARKDIVRIRVLPEFFREHSTVQIRCIIHVRLGTIILTAGMLLLSYMKERRLTESEAMKHGASHW